MGCWLLMFGEAALSKNLQVSFNGGTVWLLMPFVSYFLFVSILQINIKNIELMKRLGDYSTLIYLSHCFIIRSLKVIYSIMGIQVHSTLHFCFVLFLMFIFAFSIRYLVQNKKIALFKVLY